MGRGERRVLGRGEDDGLLTRAAGDTLNTTAQSVGGVPAARPDRPGLIGVVPVGPRS